MSDANAGAEPVIDAELAICDPHHHLWAGRGRPYLWPEYASDVAAGGHRVVRTVYVEARTQYLTDGPDALRPVGEVRHAVAQAAHSRQPGDSPVEARVEAIVAYADLLLGAAVGEVLDAERAAGDGLLRGVRHIAARDDDPWFDGQVQLADAHVMVEPAFRAGVRELARRALVFETYLFHPQLPELVDVARAVPEATVVIDHLGGPLGVGRHWQRRAETLQAWREGMAAAAACPNVRLKLGGIGMPTYGFGWRDRAEPPSSQELAAAWRDEVRWCIDTFGPQRCMFESNFPVDRATCSYRVLWNAFKRMADGYDDAERVLLFHDTAATTYGLPRIAGA